MLRTTTIARHIHDDFALIPAEAVRALFGPLIPEQRRAYALGNGVVFTVPEGSVRFTYSLDVGKNFIAPVEVTP